MKCFLTYMRNLHRIHHFSWTCHWEWSVEWRKWAAPQVVGRTPMVLKLYARYACLTLLTYTYWMESQVISNGVLFLSFIQLLRKNCWICMRNTFSKAFMMMGYESVLPINLFFIFRLFSSVETVFCQNLNVLQHNMRVSCNTDDP